MQRSALVISAFALLIAGCSGLKPYLSNQQRNLTISTQTEAKGFLANVKTSLDIYRMDAECDLDYQGTVDLSKSSVAVGIPTGEPVYLVFNFASSSFFSNSSGVMSYDTILNAEAGHDYDVNVSYRNNLYDVDVYEKIRGAVESEKMSAPLLRGNCN